jgi:hypothetical protein
MRIYIDEDMAAGRLIRPLQNAGHDVEFPTGAGMLGRSDPVQFTFAIHESRLCLTANYEDYEELHLLVREAHGDHASAMIVGAGENAAYETGSTGERWI